MPRRNRKARTPNQHPRRRHKPSARASRAPEEPPTDPDPRPEPEPRPATGISPQSPAAGWPSGIRPVPV